MGCAKSCRIVTEDCGARAQARYGGAVVVGMFDDPWRLLLAGLVSVVGFVSSTWAETPMNIQKLIIAAGVMWLLDTLSGVIRGFSRPDEGFSSAKFGCAITKALVYSLSLIAAETVDEALCLGNTFLLALASLILLRELSSFVENSAILGFPWPKPLLDKLEALREASGTEEVSTDGPEGVAAEATTVVHQGAGGGREGVPGVLHQPEGRPGHPGENLDLRVPDAALDRPEGDT